MGLLRILGLSRKEEDLIDVPQGEVVEISVPYPAYFGGNSRGSDNGVFVDFPEIRTEEYVELKGYRGIQSLVCYRWRV